MPAIRFYCSALGRSLEVLSFHATEGLNELYELRVTTRLLASDARGVSRRVLTSRGEVRITLSARAGDRARGVTTRSFFGVVTELQLGQTRGEYVDAVVVLGPAASLLAHRSSRRIFEGKTTREIVEALLGGTQTAFDWRSPRDGTRRARSFQYDETDIAYVSRLLAEDGLCFGFEHVVAAHGTRSSSERPRTEVFVVRDGTGWTDPASAMRGELPNITGEFSSTARRWAAQEEACLTLEGCAEDRLLHAGGAVNAETERLADDSSPLVVTRVEHHVRPGSSGTDMRVWCRFRAVSLPTPVDGGRRHRAARTPLHQATVVERDASPRVGRIERLRVQFDWGAQRHGARPTEESRDRCWVPALRLGCGTDVPVEEGGRVLITFLDGNPDWPVALLGLDAIEAFAATTSGTP